MTEKLPGQGFEWPSALPLSPTDLRTDAALYAAGKLLSRGTIASCLQDWSNLPLETRREAYVQPVRSVLGKRMLRSSDISSLLNALVAAPTPPL